MCGETGLLSGPGVMASLEFSTAINTQHSTPRPTKIRFPLEETGAGRGSNSGDTNTPPGQEDAEGSQAPEDAAPRHRRRDALAGV